MSRLHLNALTLVLAALLAGSFGPPALAATLKTVKAEVFPKGDPKAKPLFTYVRDVSSNPAGGRVETGVFKDPAGEVAAQEKAEFAADGALISYELDQRQLGAKGRLQVKDGRALFSYETDGKSKTADEKAEGDLVVGPSLAGYIEKNWASVQKGDALRVRFGVVDRRETVGFKFTKLGDGESAGRKGVRLKMAPSSMLIAALVDPLIFTFSPDGSHVLQFEGRTLLKQKVDGAWKDLDALTIYSE